MGPLPVEITNQTDWWQPWLPFAGSVLLFIGAMWTVWRTNRSAAKRQTEQLGAAKTQHDAQLQVAKEQHEVQLKAAHERHRAEIAAADRRHQTEIVATEERQTELRADKRADQLREEIATILAERPRMLDSQRELFDATMTHHAQSESNISTPADRTRALMDVRQKHIALCDKVQHEVIRAELLTRNSAIEAALRTIRNAAVNWNGPMQAARRGGKVDEFDRFETLQVDLGNAFDALEAATRSLTAFEFKTPVDPKDVNE